MEAAKNRQIVNKIFIDTFLSVSPMSVPLRTVVTYFFVVCQALYLFVCLSSAEQIVTNQTLFTADGFIVVFHFFLAIHL